MDHWQGALRLFRHEVGRSWGGLLTTILFFIYMSLVMSPLLHDLIAAGEENDASGVIGDFLYLTLMPNLGFMLNRGMMKYWQNDAYTRKLAYWRTLPISLNAIVLARILQHAVVLVTVSLFFFGIQYAVLKDLRGMLDIGEYLLFALIWIGYSLALGSSYMYFELMFSGRRYLVICFISFGLYVSAVLAFRFSGIAVLMETLEAAARHDPLLPAVMMVAGIAAVLAAGMLLRKRIAGRSLLG